MKIDRILFSYDKNVKVFNNIRIGESSHKFFFKLPFCLLAYICVCTLRENLIHSVN